MELNLLVSRTDQMIDDVRGRSIATGTAEPFAACQTTYNAAGIMYSTVSVGCLASLCSDFPFAKYWHCARFVETHAQACGGSSVSSSALGSWIPLALSTGMLAMLTVSSSSKASVSSSSCLRLRGPPLRLPLPYSLSRTLSSGSMVERSSPALIVEAESEIK